MNCLNLNAHISIFKKKIKTKLNIIHCFNKAVTTLYINNNDTGDNISLTREFKTKFECIF